MPPLVDSSDLEDSEVDSSDAMESEGGEKSKNSSTLPPLETPSPRSQAQHDDTPRPGIEVGLDTSGDPVLRSLVFGLSQLTQANRRTLLQQLFGEVPEFQSTPLSAGSGGSSTRMETPSEYKIKHILILIELFFQYLVFQVRGLSTIWCPKWMACPCRTSTAARTPPTRSRPGWPTWVTRSLPPRICRSVARPRPNGRQGGGSTRPSTGILRLIGPVAVKVAEVL